ncbi:porin family protein [Terrimonas rubra]|uniref:Porin family protein n=1 Tax=Terrimonas rubra TaxID=1035890 RepID=A0ABW6A5J6_9BACT
MKKIFSVAIALCAISSLSAQKFTYGIKGGVNTNQLYLSGKNDGEKVNYSSSKVGFQVGGVAELSLTNNFAIQPNVLFTLKGGKYPGSPYAVNIYSIELPLNLLYKTNGFFAGAGPNFGYGVSGKIKAEDETIDVYEENAEVPLKRFEIGANIIMGYQFPSGFNISGHYTLGLNNTLDRDNDPNDTKINNRILGFSVGYTFGKK